MPAPFRHAERNFDSLLECVTYLHSQCPNSKDLNQRARFLFRGESRLYRTTRSADERLQLLEPALRSALERPRALLLSEISGFFTRIEGAEALRSDTLGYAQHYGVPTTLIDFTSNPLVAAYFASKGRQGLIGALDCEIACRSANVVDLRQDEMAQRARTQHAFALSGYAGDLKAQAARGALGMRWFRARVSTDDRRAFREIAYVEDAHFDVAAGLVTSSVYGVVRKIGKVADDIAGFLAARLPPLPQMFSPSEGGWGLVSPAVSGGLYLPSSWRQKHRRIWSRNYPDTEADLPWRVLPPTP